MYLTNFMDSGCYNPLMQRTPGKRETKLRVNAQRVIVGPSGQKLGQSLPIDGENCKDAIDQNGKNEADLNVE